MAMAVWESCAGQEDSEAKGCTYRSDICSPITGFASRGQWAAECWLCVIGDGGCGVDLEAVIGPCLVRFVWARSMSPSNHAPMPHGRHQGRATIAR